MDGELIYSYPPEVDTIFDLEYRPPRAESFGDLFYAATLKSALHEDLKHAFIEDMVLNKEEWKKQYHIGRSDLGREEKKIFDEIELQLKNSENKMDVVVSSSDVQTMNKIGLLGSNSQRSPDLAFSSDNLLVYK